MHNCEGKNRKVFSAAIRYAFAVLFITLTMFNTPMGVSASEATLEATIDTSADDLAKGYVVDNADLLSESEEESLLTQMNQVAAKWDCEILVITTDSYPQYTITEFADDTSDSNDFGFGKRDGGIVFALAMDDRSWAISTYGSAINKFTDEGQSYMTDSMIPYLSDGDYYTAFSLFSTYCEMFLEQASTGTPYDVGNMPQNSVTPLAIIICIIIGLICGIIALLIMRTELKTVKPQRDADAYGDRGNMTLTIDKDLFIRHVVTKTPIPKDNGGGSSTHMSSGGVSHGGSSGHF